MKIVLGDMFNPLDENASFDTIFFNIPFCHKNSDKDDLSLLAQSLFDPEHDLLNRYFKEGGKYLKTNGRMLLGYSTTHGDIQLMHELAQKYNWSVTLLSKIGDESKDFITVELYEFKQKF